MLGLHSDKVTRTILGNGNVVRYDKKTIWSKIRYCDPLQCYILVKSYSKLFLRCRWSKRYIVQKGIHCSYTNHSDAFIHIVVSDTWASAQKIMARRMYGRAAICWRRKGLYDATMHGRQAGLAASQENPQKKSLSGVYAIKTASYNRSKVRNTNQNMYKVGGMPRYTWVKYSLCRTWVTSLVWKDKT